MNVRRETPSFHDKPSSIRRGVKAGRHDLGLFRVEYVSRVDELELVVYTVIALQLGVPICFNDA